MSIVAAAPTMNSSAPGTRRISPAVAARTICAPLAAMACSTALRPTDQPLRERRRGLPPFVALLRVILLRALAGLAALAAHDAAAQPGPSACSSATIATGEVSRVIDGKSFVLRDGSEVRLAAIEAPPLAVTG